MDCMEMGTFINEDWESLCKMLTFEEPDLGVFVDPQNVSFSDTQNSEFSHNNFPSDLCFNNIGNNCWSNTPVTYQNSHLDSSPSSSFAFPQNETPFTSPFSFENMINEADAEEHSQSACTRSPITAEIPLKRKNNALEVEPKKKARISKYRVKKTLQCEEVDDMTNVETSASEEISDGENSATKEIMAATLKGKKRANRGEATDPQSLYARRRRQRINERLRILQNLVPNGTKVDISTMLEEAVNYVKFLQLQIKLLSSDELWMYAPLAYNGVDINLYQKISPFLLD